MIGILIGFAYDNRDDELPGILLDLYKIYKCLKSFNIESVILTDIEKKIKKEVVNNILNNDIDLDIINFFEKVENYKIIKTPNELIDFLENIKKMDDLIFYYSGHFNDKKIILPNRIMLSLDFLLEKLNNIYEKSCLFIFDCCNFSGLGLCFDLNDEGIFIFKPMDFYYHKNIICISSSSIDEKSEASYKGSIFTTKLLNCFNGGIQTYKKLKKETLCKISSSYFLDKIIDLSINNKIIKLSFYDDYGIIVG